MSYTDAWFSLKEVLYKKLQTEKQLLFENSKLGSAEIASTLEIVFLNMNHLEEKHEIDGPKQEVV